MSEDTPSKQRPFEALVDELTRVVETLEKGELPLEKALEHYTRGRELLKQARQILDQAQARLQELTTEGQGTPSLEDRDIGDFVKGDSGRRD